MTRLSFLILFACFFSNAQAQNRFGFKAGFGFATFSGVDEDNLEGELGSILSIPIGLLYEIKLSDKLTLQPEFIFRQKGFKDVGISESSSVGFKFKSKFVTNYLELPVLLRYHFGSPDEIRFFLSLGPSFAYTTNAYNVLRITALGQSNRERQPLNLNDLAYNRFEMSADLGLGVNIPMDVGVLEFDLRYLLGLTNVNKENAGDNVNYNRGFSFTMGYKVAFYEIED